MFSNLNKEGLAILFKWQLILFSLDSSDIHNAMRFAFPVPEKKKIVMFFTASKLAPFHIACNFRDSVGE